MLFQRSLVFVCACLYLAHVNNVCAPIQRVVGVWMQLGASARGCVCLCACGWDFF